MEGNLGITRRFFKVLLPGFQQKLKLPLAFCERLKEEKSKWAMLRSRQGTWKISVCRNCEGLICFKDGWPQFVYHHGLSVGDFILFEHTAELHFNVIVFDSSACEKEFVVELKKEPGEITEAVSPSCHPKKTMRESNKDSAISYHRQNPYFVLTMKPCHARMNHRVTIPIEFVRSSNLGPKKSASLRDPRGREWPMKLSLRREGRRTRMWRGWHDFYASNELKDGDVCVFDLNSRSLRSTTVSFDVQIFPAPM